MQSIIEKILGRMKVSLPQFKFLIHLFPLLLYFQGKANFRNLSRYSPFSEKTFSRNFQKTLNFKSFNQKLIDEVPVSEHSLLLTIDPSFVSKSGDSTYGLDFYYNASASRAEKGLEISLVALVDLNADTAYTLSVQQTPPSKTPSKCSPKKKEKARKAKLEWIFI